MRADPARERSAEALLEDVGAVHRIGRVGGVGRDAAEVEAPRAARPRLDDATPEQPVRRVRLATGVVRRAVLVHLTIAAAPGHRAGDRLVLVLGEPERGEFGVDERAPHLAVVVGGARDEARAPAGEGVQVIERTEVRVGRPPVELDAALLGLLDAPPSVLLEAAQQRVLVSVKVKDERRCDRLDVRAPPEAGRREGRPGLFRGPLGIDLEDDGAGTPLGVLGERAQHIRQLRRRDDRTARAVAEVQPTRQGPPEHERVGAGGTEELGAPALPLADRRPGARLHHVAVRSVRRRRVPSRGRIGHRAAAASRRRPAIRQSG